jgi:hypothetical protein
VADKVTFDAPNRLIIGVLAEIDVNGFLNLDWNKDVYSLAKQKWIADDVLSGHPFPFRVVGGDPITATQTAPAFFFMQNGTLDVFGQVAGWQFQPAEADHTVLIVDNVVQESLTDQIFIPTTGDFTVLIRGDVFLAQTVETPALSVTEQDRLKRIDRAVVGRVSVSLNDQMVTIFDDDGTTPLVNLVVSVDGRERTTDV